MDKETYDSLPLIGWLDKVRRPIDNHPELPADEQKAKLFVKESGGTVKQLLRSRLVGELLMAKRYDLEKIETGTVMVEQMLMSNQQTRKSRRNSTTNLSEKEESIALRRS